MLLIFKKAVFGYRLLLFTTKPTMIGNRTLFVGNDNFDTGFENGFFQIFFVVHPVFRVGTYDFYIGITDESLRHLLNILCERRVTEKVNFISRSRLMSLSLLLFGCLR